MCVYWCILFHLKHFKSFFSFCGTLRSIPWHPFNESHLCSTMLALTSVTALMTSFVYHVGCHQKGKDWSVVFVWLVFVFNDMHLPENNLFYKPESCTWKFLAHNIIYQEWKESTKICEYFLYKNMRAILLKNMWA